MEEEGEMEEEKEDEGGAPMRIERNEEREKKAPTLQECLSLSFSLLIHSPG